MKEIKFHSILDQFNTFQKTGPFKQFLQNFQHFAKFEENYSTECSTLLLRLITYLRFSQKWLRRFFSKHFLNALRTHRPIFYVNIFHG